MDGNKRIVIYVMISFLEINGVKMQYEDEELVTLGLGIADGSFDYPQILKWVISHKQK